MTKTLTPAKEQHRNKNIEQAANRLKVLQETQRMARSLSRFGFKGTDQEKVQQFKDTLTAMASTDPIVKAAFIELSTRMAFAAWLLNDVKSNVLQIKPRLLKWLALPENAAIRARVESRVLAKSA